MKDLYQIDLEKTQQPKLINVLPKIDIVITMGCEAECPFLPSLYREDWGLDDPTGQPYATFKETAKTIAAKVIDLAKRIKKV